MSGRIIGVVVTVFAVVAILGLTLAGSASSLTQEQIGLRNQVLTSEASSWYFDIYDESTSSIVHSEIIDVQQGQGGKDGGATTLDSSRTYTVEITPLSGNTSIIVGASCDGSLTGTWDNGNKITGISAPGAEYLTCTFVT